MTQVKVLKGCLTPTHFSKSDQMTNQNFGGIELVYWAEKLSASLNISLSNFAETATSVGQWVMIELTRIETGLKEELVNHNAI